LNTEEKIEIARQLSRLGVDVLEAGFPIASIGDFEAVKRIATEVGPLMEGRENIGKPMVSIKNRWFFFKKNTQSSSFAVDYLWSCSCNT
jgi:isopropylmalate/homocitrate/citramalate synthase